MCQVQPGFPHHLDQFNDISSYESYVVIRDNEPGPFGHGSGFVEKVEIVKTPPWSTAHSQVGKIGRHFVKRPQSHVGVRTDLLQEILNQSQVPVAVDQ